MIDEKDFKKISELGAGTFGQVEKMHHKPSNTELAVKVFYFLFLFSFFLMFKQNK